MPSSHIHETALCRTQQNNVEITFLLVSFKHQAHTHTLEHKHIDLENTRRY